MDRKALTVSALSKAPPHLYPRVPSGKFCNNPSMPDLALADHQVLEETWPPPLADLQGCGADPAMDLRAVGGNRHRV